MMDLTIDEKMLILLYSPGTRMGLYGALQHIFIRHWKTNKNSSRKS